MKTLIFDTNEKYEFVYQAMSLCETGYKGIQLRHVNKIFDKLESIGKVKENGNGYKLDFEFADNSTEWQAGTEFTYPSIDLEEPEFDLLLTTFDTIPWTPAGARLAYKVHEWLHGLK